MGSTFSSCCGSEDNHSDKPTTNDYIKQSVKERIDTLLGKILSLEEENEMKEQAIATRTQRSEALIGELEKKVRGLEEKKGGLEKRQKEILLKGEKTERELSKLKAKHEETAALLAERTKLLNVRTDELSSAKALIDMGDTHSETELKSMVEDLNEAITQATSSIVESLTTPWKDGSVESASASDIKLVSEYIGPKLVELLESEAGRDGRKGPNLLQLALQTCMTVYAGNIVMAWSFDRSKNDHLAVIHRRMGDREGLGISNSWRALTRRHIDEWNIVVESKLCFSLHDLLSSILTTSGCDMEPSAIVTLLHSCKERINKTVELSLGLNKAIGEEMMSAEYSVRSFQAGSDFDSKAMDDTYPGREESQVVLFTTGLGLCRQQKGGSEWLLKTKVTADIIP